MRGSRPPALRRWLYRQRRHWWAIETVGALRLVRAGVLLVIGDRLTLANPLHCGFAERRRVHVRLDRQTPPMAAQP